MEFKKYSEIENSYREKFINKVIQYCPELTTKQFVITEKIDGSNLQLVFTPHQEMQVGKRTSFLQKDESFFDVWNTLKQYDHELKIIQNYVNKTGETIRLYGELFGPGIQKRINYGDKKRVLFYDMYIGETLLAFAAMKAWFLVSKIEYMLVPVLDIVDSLDKALSYNNEFNSKILNIDNNMAEGIVIKPYDEVIRLLEGSHFILKKKNENFKEKMEGNKSENSKVEYSEGTWKLAEEFKQYINENRLAGVFSKNGPITDPKQMGNYIRLLLEDAKNDFFKDHEGLTLSKEEDKMIFNVGKDIVNMLRKHL
jgi:Rnl2 family RNA ligase